MDLPRLATFARRPRDALMWIPRALDVARLRALIDAAGPRVVDVGAGTGLLAALLDRPMDCVDPEPPRVRYHPVRASQAANLEGPYDVAIVSWMEAGKDYREASARLAPVVVNCYDVEGGCGVMGAVDFEPFGFAEATSWRTPSFEDAAYALDHRGVLQRRGYPGNRIDVLTRDKARAAALEAAVLAATPGPRLPWEDEMDKARL